MLSKRCNWFYFQVLELLQESGEGFDTMCLLRTLGQVKTDVTDSKKTLRNNKETNKMNEQGERVLFCWLFILNETNCFLYLTWIFGFQMIFFQLSD